jgi:hypothetical protein
MAATPTLTTRADLLRFLKSRGVAFEILQDGPRWAVVTPSLAARIIGAGAGEENAFWVSPAEPPGSGWFNAGGQRSWLAPESGPRGIFCAMDLAAWTVPPQLDPGRYAAEPASAARAWRTEIEVRAADGTRHRVDLSRSLALEEHPRIPGALAIRFRHEIANRARSTLDRRLGLWGLIQLPCEEGGGTAFLSLSRRDGELTPYFGGVPAFVKSDKGSVGWLPLRGGSRFKAGIPPALFSGTMGFVRRSRMKTAGGELLLTAMSFKVQPGETYVDRSPAAWGTAGSGDAAQVYQDPGTGPLAFCEIEAHAPAARLAPGETAAQEILITVAPVAEDGVGAALADGLGVGTAGAPLR